MKKIIFGMCMLFLLFLVGCLDEETDCPSYYDCPEVDKEVEIMYLDKECPECVYEKPTECNVTISRCNYTESYVEGLMQEAKKCEKSQYYYDIDECHSELNVTREDYNEIKEDYDEDKDKWEEEEDEYRNRIDNLKDDLDDCEDDLRDCERDLCSCDGSYC